LILQEDIGNWFKSFRKITVNYVIPFNYANIFFSNIYAIVQRVLLFSLPAMPKKKLIASNVSIAVNMKNLIIWNAYTCCKVGV